MRLHDAVADSAEQHSDSDQHVVLVDLCLILLARVDAFCKPASYSRCSFCLKTLLFLIGAIGRPPQWLNFCYCVPYEITKQ